jgi:hypothetical protein
MQKQQAIAQTLAVNKLNIRTFTLLQLHHAKNNH